jgi:hypothetical protein
MADVQTGWGRDFTVSIVIIGADQLHEENTRLTVIDHQNFLSAGDIPT